MKKTIVLTGGGTAGHVMPCLALLPHLECSFDRIVYIGSENGMEKRLAQNAGTEYRSVTTVKLRRSLSPKNLAIPFLLAKGVGQAKRLLAEIKPDVVFSKGGFVGVPVVTAAKSLGIPVVLHESDMSVGLANRLCRRKADCFCVTFPETLEKVPNGVLTGVPVRAELFCGNKYRALSSLGLTRPYPNVLFMGGSQGAARINAALRENLPAFTEKFNVIHICGKGNLSSAEEKNYAQIEFTDNIADIFAAADLVVCRSGSNTINELLLLKKPMLLIPLSKRASRGDQIENAESFARRGFARVLYEEKLTPNSLLLSTELTFNERHKLVTAMSSAKKLSGVKNVLNEILKAAKEEC